MGEDKAAAEIAARRAAAEEAHAWGDEMRLVMLAALFGTDRTGRNAAIGRILREWAVEQIEECPGADNYLELSLDYTESTPGLVVLVHIQREDGETPGNRATRLQAERDAAVARAEAKLAALSLACAHCGPESAGPAGDRPTACATCYGDLILTDAAGAAVLRRRYDEAVAESQGEGERTEVSDG